MPQSFKSKPPPKKAKSSASQRPKDPKKGARTIAPKKSTLVNAANVHRKNTSSHSSSLEKNIAAQAMSYGKLTIMRKAAEEVKKDDKK
ncbi:hypothetical protein JCM10207_008858 [Rhodosporidiobolus poonsookiae]